MEHSEALGKVLDNIINDKSDQAEVFFHDYLQNKLEVELHGDINITDDNTTQSQDEDE